MIIKSAIEVGQPVDRVWEFCQDISQVAACLPGAEITGELGPDQYSGKVVISMGPVKMNFSGTAEVTRRDADTKTLVIDAVGADESGQEQARLGLTVQLAPSGAGTALDVTQDIHLSGAAAQFGRGMVGDVSQILMSDFASNMHDHIDAMDKGISTDQIQRSGSASGIIGLRAAWMALKRVARRFFLPYQPSQT